MTAYIGDNVPFDGGITELAGLTHSREGSRVYQRAQALLEEAMPLLRPRYVLKEVTAGVSPSGLAVLGGIEFNSKIVAAKIDCQERAFVNIVTCGREIADRVLAEEDQLDQYILDQIAYMAMKSARAALLQRLEHGLGVKEHISLAPGSIIDWSVAEVKKIFTLLEGDYQAIGVRVLDSGLIDPLKSASGFYVESGEDFHSCDICPRLDCPSRLSAFDAEKHQQMTGL